MDGRNLIKLFQFNQKYCETIGIRLLASNQSHYRLNSKNLILIFFVVQFAIASAAFVVYDAESMGEYGVTFFVFIATVISMVDYSITIWKREFISTFTENCEVFIEKSKLDLFTRSALVLWNNLRFPVDKLSQCFHQNCRFGGTECCEFQVNILKYFNYSKILREYSKLRCPTFFDVAIV